MNIRTTKSKRIIGRVASLLAAIAFATACSTIDDNLDDCFSMSRLRFRYVNNLPGVDRFSRQVESIDLYAYTAADSTFVGSRSFTKDEIIKDGVSKEVSLGWLPMDDYIIAVFGNLDEDHYDATGADAHHLSALNVKMLCSDREGTITENPCHFFHGIVEVAEQDRDTKTVDMTKSTNDIVVIINDLTPENRGTRALGAREMKVTVNTKNNGSINHDNSLATYDNREMRHTHTPTAQGTVDHRYRTTVTVGKLFHNDGATLTLATVKANGEPGEVLVTENLTGKIIERWKNGEIDPEHAALDPNEYLEKQDTYTFVYNLELVHGVLVTSLVSVEDWNKIEQGGQGSILW